MTRAEPAEALLRSLGVAQPDEIDVEAIAWSVGAKVREGKLESCEARIIGFKDRAIITVREGGNPRRKRFSIAHELGHWTYHRGHSSVCRANEIGNPGIANQVERQADQFAADLLMPRYLFGASVARHKRPSFEMIDALASEYSTSRIATTLRCVDIAGRPIMLVCHGVTGRRWFKRSELIPDHWCPRSDLDPSSPSMAVLFGNLDRSRPQTIAADAWFDRRDAATLRVVEQSSKSHGGEMLTLLTFNDPNMLC